MRTFLIPGSDRTLLYKPIKDEWFVFRFGQIPGKTHESFLHDDSIFLLLHARRYMFAVGPPRSEMTPVKSGTFF